MMACLLLGGCANVVPSRVAHLPSGPRAYANFPTPSAEPALASYRIAPMDQLDVTVYREPELSLKAVTVDEAGHFRMPLIGDVEAAGKTPGQLTSELASRYRRYLVKPQVSVVVATSSTARVTVTGSVTEPGVYPLRGRTTLMEAVALAKGPTRVADLDEALIFRNVNGQRMAARFDLRAISRGRAPDPEIRGTDVVVVGESVIGAAWREVREALPSIGVFRLFY